MKYLKLLPIACMLLTPAVNAQDVIVDSGDGIFISNTKEPLSTSGDFYYYAWSGYGKPSTVPVDYVLTNNDSLIFLQTAIATDRHEEHYSYPAFLLQLNVEDPLTLDSIQINGTIDATKDKGQTGFNIRGTRKLNEDTPYTETLVNEGTDNSFKKDDGRYYTRKLHYSSKENNTLTVNNGIIINKTAKIYSGALAAVQVKDLVELEGDIINYGLIKGSIENGFGLVTKSFIKGDIINHGTIEASIAIQVVEDISGEIINYGNIKGKKYAIQTENKNTKEDHHHNDEEAGCVIQNYGTITAVDKLVYNNHEDSFKFTNHQGGYIEGKYIDLGKNGVLINEGEINCKSTMTINGGYFDNKGKAVIPTLNVTSSKLILHPTDTSNPTLNLSGTAEFTTDSTVALDPKASFFKDKELSAGQKKEIIILQATTLNGTPKVESNHFRLTIVGDPDNSGDNNKTLSVVVSIKSLTSVLDEVKIPQDQKKFAEQLAKDTPAMNTIASVYGSIDELHSVEKIKECIAQLKPDTASTETNATTNITGNLLQGISARGSSTNSGLNSGDGVNNSDVWWQYLKNHATQASGDDALGYKSTTSGLTLGFDHDFNNIKAGVAFNFANAKINFERDQAINILQKAVAVYGIVPHNNFVVGASASYSHANNEISRLKGEATVNGEHKATSISGQLWLATEHKVLTCSLQPKISLRGYNVNVDTYTLANPDATITETHSKLEKSSVALGVGASIEKTIVNNNTMLTPRLAVDYFRNLNETTKGGEINFAGEEYLTTGTIIKHKFESQAELAMQHKQVTFSVTHVFSKMKDYHANSIFAKVKYNF